MQTTRSAGTGRKRNNMVTWDGKDFASIQIETWNIPRDHGRPFAEVDRDWNLFLGGDLVPRGTKVFPDGSYEPGEWT